MQAPNPEVTDTEVDTGTDTVVVEVLEAAEVLEVVLGVVEVSGADSAKRLELFLFKY